MKVEEMHEKVNIPIAKYGLSLLQYLRPEEPFPNRLRENKNHKKFKTVFSISKFVNFLKGKNILKVFSVTILMNR